MRRLYRDSTQYVGGKHVRDLSKLNRDMRQVMFITADPDAAELQPENAIKVRSSRRACWDLFVECNWGCRLRVRT